MEEDLRELRERNVRLQDENEKLKKENGMIQNGGSREIAKLREDVKILSVELADKENEICQKM